MVVPDFWEYPNRPLMNTMTFSTLSFFKLPTKLARPQLIPRPTSVLSTTSVATDQTEPVPESDSNANPQAPKLKPSSQLHRWSRARALRTGRKLDRPYHRSTPLVEPTSSVTVSPEPASKDSVNGYDVDLSTGKSIYLISDGTGWTVEHSVNAALGQFDYCFVDRGCPIDDVERLMEIIKQAAKEGAMVVYTLADPSMAQSAKQACKLWSIPSTDMLGPLTEAIASHLGVSPSGLPRGAPGRTLPLSDDYFRRIEAIEFTIKQDDGALPKNLHKADIVLAGVSRTGKTPLSIYLAQKGYKVANVPIVMGLELPKTLFEIDPEKVFGLTISPLVLQTIRRSRAKTLGFSEGVRSNYSEMDYVKQELEFARKIFSQNPTWPVIEVTGKAIEETAALVLRLYYDKKNKCQMPRISKRY